MTRIGIYCGRFSPPHCGHVAAARAFMEQMWLDFLYVLPSATDASASPEDRLAMCRAAFAGMEGVYVSDMTVRRGGEGDPLDTLRELSGEDRRLFLLLGTDELLSLGARADAGEIFARSYPVYVRREGPDPILENRIILRIREMGERYGKIVRRILTDPMEISSTELRRAIRAGREVSGDLPPMVENYIRNKHLYV